MRVRGANPILQHKSRRYKMGITIQGRQSNGNRVPGSGVCPPGAPLRCTWQPLSSSPACGGGGGVTGITPRSQALAGLWSLQGLPSYSGKAPRAGSCVHPGLSSGCWWLPTNRLPHFLVTARAPKQVPGPQTQGKPPFFPSSWQIGVL